MPYKDPKSPAAVASSRKRNRKTYYKHRDKILAKAKINHKIYYQNHREKILETNKIIRSQKLLPEQVLFNNARQRARRLELPFNLEVSDLIVPNYCPVLGLPLKVATGHAEPNSPSVDRFDPAKGYVKGNVRVISHKANTIKSNASIEEIKLVLKYMEEGSGTDKRF